MSNTKKYLAIILVSLTAFLYFSGCDKKDDFDDYPCGEYNNIPLWKESDGRCYYIREDGHKVYVESSECNCS